MQLLLSQPKRNGPSAMPVDQSDYPEDVKMMAWVITSKHLCRGERDISRIVADAIWQERQRSLSETTNQTSGIQSAW